MLPKKPSSVTPGKAVNPISSKFVIWDGPEITCLDGTVLCKGKEIETHVYDLAIKLCRIYDSLSLNGIETCINSSDNESPITISASSTIQQVFSAIISKVCEMSTRIVELENNECPANLVVVDDCFVTEASQMLNYDSLNNTLPVNDYAVLVAQTVCSLLVSIQAINSAIAGINLNIQELWNTLNSCSNNCDLSVLPTCTYDYVQNPDGGPVSIQIGYEWLEAVVCNLKSAIGDSDSISSAISKQCPNLNTSDRLSAGGTMSNLSGWESNPTTLADSLGNLWLTVCDMRAAVSNILSTCCFSVCDYFQLGYVIHWDQVNGDYLNITFNDPSNPSIYTDPAVVPDPASPWSAVAGGPLPAFVSTSFTTASQSNVQLTFTDEFGVTVVVDTGKTINEWAIESNGDNNGYHVDFTDPAFAGYDYTSQQSLNISFQYDVIPPATPATTCYIDQTDGLTYECCTTPVYPCDVQISSPNGTDIKVEISGVIVESDPKVTSTATGPGASTDTLEDTNADFITDNVLADDVVYLSNGTITECRRVVTISSATEIVVDSDWSITLTGGESYVIKDKYYNLNTYTPGSNDCIDNLTGFKLQYIQVTNTYDPLDPSTWVIIFEIDNVSPVVLYGAGYTTPQDTFQGNTDYAIAITSNHNCGSSTPDGTYNPFTYKTPVVASVTLEIGDPANPVGSVFSSVYIPVTDITSNDVTPTAPDGSVTIPAPIFKFPLELPIGGNVSEFKVEPALPVWVNTTPPPFCLCGLTVNPFGTTGGQDNHDITLGSYRGYNVKMMTKDPVNGIYTTIDSTDSLTDPTLGFGGASPFTLSIPGNYAQTQYPTVVRYEPIPVNLSPTFHEININAMTYAFTKSYVGVSTVRLKFIVEVYMWNGTTYVPYATPKQYVLDCPGMVVATGSGTAPLFTPTTIACKYGDALLAQVLVYYPTAGTPAYDYEIVAGAVGGSTYSCAGQTRTETAISNPMQNEGSPADRKRGNLTCIITEDLDLTLEAQLTIT